MCRECENLGVYSQEKYFTWLDDIFEVNRPLFTIIVGTMQTDVRQDYAAWCIAQSFATQISEAVNRLCDDY